ncbi:DUF6265 family protein [Luteimonas sp. 8-5]|uniref:DUF6265 family protein n=1 Tax=Luteimonas sp. 8-5 TaxID=3039387 RepID=UPI002436791B|nr:DUF6265 family protein [Luteimonas sp. 8-5]MDG6348545.1 DUF6265 family protein [Luteimonas sp. 8-5]
MQAMKAIWAVGCGLALASGTAQADLAWLEGRWCGGNDGRRIDEAWLPQAGDMLMGMSRTVRDGKVESFEFMRIVVDGDAASFHVQPNGVPPTVFAMEDRGEGWIRFANEAHDFPNRVEYRRNGDGLSAWIAGPGEDGAELRIPFEYRRCGS